MVWLSKGGEGGAAVDLKCGIVGIIVDLGLRVGLGRLDAETDDIAHFVDEDADLIAELVADQLAALHADMLAAVILDRNVISGEADGTTE